MSSNAIHNRKISDLIADRIEGMILEGSLEPKQKLPPERELSTQFEVSRPSVREAMQKLEAKGLVTRRQGGGTFVSADFGSSFVDPLVSLFRSHPEFNYDLLEYRHTLEAAAAYYATARATETDHQLIEERYQQWLKGHEQEVGVEAEAELDWRFHLSIAESAHNAVLLHSMRSLFNLFKKTTATNLNFLTNKKGECQEVIRAQHEKLQNAVIARDEESARKAVNEHLAYVEETLQKGSRFETNAQRSLRRLYLKRNE
ncbi:MAG: GntR family transcriptional regulator [Oceanobacter sp.]